jgi:hypothetical protein
VVMWTRTDGRRAPNLRITDVRRSAQAALTTVTVRDRDRTPA